MRNVATALDNWVEKHENDSGGRSFMERHEIACHVLWCLSQALSEAADNMTFVLNEEAS